MVHRHGYLTRLFTTMSESEMTLDPIFVQDDGLGDVPSYREAVEVRECSVDYYRDGAPTRWEVGERTYPGERGMLADDRAYCAAFGGIPISDMPSCSSMRDSSSSSGCSLSHRGEFPAAVGLLCVAAGVYLMRRRRRGSRG